MMNFIRAARFILHSQLGASPRVAEDTVELASGGERFPALVYRPAEGRTRGTILVVAGMSVHGHRDARLTAIGRAFSSVGFVTVLPCFRDIEEFRITVMTIDTIASAIRAVAGDPLLSPHGRVSLFSPSFSAAMCIIAAARPDTSKLTTAVCSVGTFGNVDTVIRFLLERQDADEYGRMIVLRNFLHLSLGSNAGVEKALEICYLDNGFHRPEPELPAYLEGLPAADREVFTRLRNEPSFRLGHWERILNAGGEMRTLVDELSVVKRLASLRTPVALIHGADDSVIPPSESVMIFQELRRLGVPCRLVLTPLITHGDTAIGITALPELFRLARVFAFFLRNAGRPISQNRHTAN